MAALRQIPLKQMVIISLLGFVLAEVFKVYHSRFRHLEVLVGLYVFQVVTYSFYAMFIYPFYTSPLRNLPLVKGGLPLVGQGRDLRKYGPGVMAKKWYVSVLEG